MKAKRKREGYIPYSPIYLANHGYILKKKPSQVYPLTNCKPKAAVLLLGEVRVGCGKYLACIKQEEIVRSRERKLSVEDD